MPDIQTEMQKILQAWEQPELPESQPEPQPKKPSMFTPTNNVTHQTFQFVVDNPGTSRGDCIKRLVQLGHKKASVSSLVGQMLRQGHIRKDSNNCLHANGTEFTPLKSAKTIINAEKRAKGIETSKVRTYKKRLPKEVPVPAGIAALAVEHKHKDRVQEIMDTISLPDAKRLHKTLNEYFGSV